MATDQALHAIISVIDQTAAPFAAINARFAGVHAKLGMIGNSLGNLSKEIGLTGIASHARSAFGEVRHLGEGLLELAGPLAALSAAGSLAGLVEIAKSTGEWGKQLYLGHIATGMSTE